LITVPIDRAAALRNAEKLLRQGKLEPAIAEYVRVLDDQPTDWNTANLLGDLYARAGQLDRAVEQFARIADSLSLEGFLPKANALYKKIIKLQPDHEHALTQAGEIAAGMGLFADARALLGAVAERRQSRGDARGAAAMRIRLGTLDPADFERRIGAACARAELGDTRDAVEDLKQIAGELDAKDRHLEAVEALRRAVLLDPDDEPIRTQLLDFYVDAEDFGRAREFATTVDQLKALADALDLRGRHDEAIDTLRDAVWMAPDDRQLRAHIARACVARGDIAGAAEFASADTAGDDPDLLLLVTEVQLRAARGDDGLAAARRLLDLDYSAREALASVGLQIAADLPDAGQRLLELVTDAAVARSDWAWSAARLAEFSRRAPNSIPVLMRLIEICVDGELEGAAYEAQAMLADAYLAAGRAAEARVIAEDLVLHDPSDRAHLDRYRRALMLTNEPDPDAAIARCLSGGSSEPDPLVADRPAAASAPPEPPIVRRDPPPPASTAAPRQPVASDPPDHRAPEPSPAAATRRDAPPSIDAQFALGRNAIDIEQILNELDGPPATAHASSESVEVDLSVVLDDIKKPSLIPTPAAAPITSSDLDGAFDQLREQAGGGSPIASAEAEYTRALAFQRVGDIEACIAALTHAAGAPRLQFAAASLLAELFRQRGNLDDAIEWLERAAEAPAPAPADSHRVLYDLADALETIGESTRALAVCLELQADAGPYRDVAARIDRLTRVQARG
jgi:tetratricopeptide (TPR) repeat protein